MRGLRHSHPARHGCLSTRATAKPELDRICEVTGPTIVFVDADCSDKVNSGFATRITAKLGSAKPEEKTLAGLVDAFMGKMPKRHDINLDDLQAIKFTGGSSGQPKGCMQTYRVWNTCITSMLIEFNFDENDRHLLARADDTRHEHVNYANLCRWVVLKC